VSEINAGASPNKSDIRLLLRSDMLLDEELRQNVVSEHRARVVYRYWPALCEISPYLYLALDNFLHDHTVRGDELGALEIEYDWETRFAVEEDPADKVAWREQCMRQDIKKVTGILTILHCFGISTTIRLPGTPTSRKAILNRLCHLRGTVPRQDATHHFWRVSGWWGKYELVRIADDKQLRQLSMEGTVHSPARVDDC
jgi:hypothetical protein